MTDSLTTEERVKQVVANIFHRNIDEISEGVSFSRDLHAKSLNTIELQAVLEGEFDVEIPGAGLRATPTVGDAIKLIKSLLGEN